MPAANRTTTGLLHSQLAAVYRASRNSTEPSSLRSLFPSIVSAATRPDVALASRVRAALSTSLSRTLHELLSRGYGRVIVHVIIVSQSSISSTSYLASGLPPRYSPNPAPSRARAYTMNCHGPILNPRKLAIQYGTTINELYHTPFVVSVGYLVPGIKDYEHATVMAS